MFYPIRTAIVLTFFMSSMYPTIAEHTFEVEKGVIIYDIYGGGVLTDETNLTLNGKATLRFKDWGMTLLSHDEGVVETLGSIRSKQHIESSEKQTKEALYTVDFKNKKIHERKNSIANALKEHNTLGLKKIGKDEVLGIICNVWEGHGIRKCLYKGVPLKIESEVLGISYHKIAKEIVFDINDSNDKCTLPNFPKESFALFNSALKTKNETKAKCFTDVLKDVAYTIEKKSVKNTDNLNISKKDKRVFLNKIGQKIFMYQKEQLPKLLRSMKKARECLQTGDDIFEANECMEDFREMKKQLGTDDNAYIVLLNEKRKNRLVDKLEDEVIYLQSRMSCVNRSKNITDLSTCMK